ncbi:hypothetical protein ASAP_0721 [Asaia bogorensis]|uniref:Uncharacterized protein n=1 Tax=Asaia bogorensis TaxID=91915 RepID=A0A060QHQ2_9PROT|nr:hypothetical protein ASAP_0721 [Asaia bogorensis]
MRNLFCVTLSFVRSTGRLQMDKDPVAGAAVQGAALKPAKGR